MEKRADPQFDTLLRDVLRDDSHITPDAIVNARLKARLYQTEEAKEAQKGRVKKIPLWYLPVLMSVLGSLVLSFAAVALMDGVLRYAVLAAAVNMSLGSAALTAAGVRRASWRETMTLTLFRRKKASKGGGL